jgi:hypothetical protein
MYSLLYSQITDLVKILAPLLCLMLLLPSFAFAQEQAQQPPQAPAFLEGVVIQSDEEYEEFVSGLTDEQKQEFELYKQLLSEAIPDDAEVGDLVTVATLNIYDAAITNQTGHVLEVAFELYNRELAQPQVTYGIELRRPAAEGAIDSVLVDRYIRDGWMSLGEDTSITVNDTYEIPEYISGTYEVWVRATNNNALGLGFAYLGEVTLDEVRDSVVTENCVLLVEGEDTEYVLCQGVDIAADEVLLIQCEMKNTADTAITFHPTFVTHHRSVYGPEVASVTTEMSTTLAGKETKTVVYALPVVEAPQSYDVTVQPVNAEGDAVGHSVVAHYVLQGKSATIQNVRLDKNMYAAGDEARAEVFWTPSADSFYGSRAGVPTDIGTVTLALALVDSTGDECAVSVENEQSSYEAHTTVTFAVTKTCVNPTVVMHIADAEGAVLDEQTYAVETAQVEEVTPVATTDTDTDKTHGDKGLVAIVVVLVVVVLGILATLLWSRRGCNKVVSSESPEESTSPEENKPGTPPTSMLLLLVLAGTFFAGVETASADTFSVNYSVLGYGKWYPHHVMVDMNLNKRKFTPGEWINAWINVYHASCHNSIIRSQPRISGAIGSGWYQGGTGTRNYSIWGQARWTDGWHRVNFHWQDCGTPCSGWGGHVVHGMSGVWWKDHSIWYEVATPPPPTPVNGSCGVNNGGVFNIRPVFGLCAAGDLVWTDGVGADGQWNWNCNGRHGGTNESCSADKNQKPQAIIDTPADGAILTPNTSNAISGHGIDPEGRGISDYAWKIRPAGESCLLGLVENEASSWGYTPTVGGNKRICFAVQDTDGAWSDWASIEVTIPDIPTVTLEVIGDNSIFLNEDATLRWTSTNADSCVADGGWSALTTTSGSDTVSPTTVTTYTVTCYGPGGDGESNPVVVYLKDPELTFWTDDNSPLTAGTDDGHVDIGENVELKWEVRGAADCRATAGQPGWTLPDADKDHSTGVHSQSVAMGAATDQFELECDNGVGGVVHEDLTVYVPDGDLTATSCTISTGDSSCQSQVTWSSDYLLGTPKLFQENELTGARTELSISGGNDSDWFAVNEDTDTFIFRDYDKNLEITVESDAQCAFIDTDGDADNDNTWVSDLGACVIGPDVDLSVIDGDEFIRNGETATLKVTLTTFDTRTVQCDLKGGSDDSFSKGSPGTIIQQVETEELAATQITNVECYDTVYPVLRDSDDVRIEVTPVSNEI